MFNVLRAYSNHDSEIGYTQGIKYEIMSKRVNRNELYSWKIAYYS